MIYVDTMMDHAWKLRGRYVRSCHLMGDSTEELLAFGARIGLKASWIQGVGQRGRVPHFDLVESKRSAAVAASAREIAGEEFVAVYRRLRDEALAASFSVPSVPSVAEVAS